MNFMALIQVTPECEIDVVGLLKIDEMVAILGRKLLGSPGFASVPGKGFSMGQMVQRRYKHHHSLFLYCFDRRLI